MSAAASSIHENWVQPRQKLFTKTREREQFTQLSGDNGSLGLVSAMMVKPEPNRSE